MKKAIVLLSSVAVFFTACNNNQQAAAKETADSSAVSSVDPSKDWKFGIALWTFHTFSFSQGLDKVDSAGVHYIEPNTFSKTLPELKDSAMLQLSPSGIEKLKTLIAARGLKLETIYVAGDTTIQSWVKQFEIAKQVGARYVTGEPPLKLWDGIDSLAGV